MNFESIISPDNFELHALEEVGDQIFRELTCDIQQHQEDEMECTPISPTTEQPDLSKFLCRVCQDCANGINYGALSCNGCRSFFRRTVLSPVKFSCKNGDGNCNIVKRQRNFCKACRFDRCIKAGMQMEDVQIVDKYVPIVKRSRMDPPLLAPVVVDNSVILRSTQTLNISHLLETYYASLNATKDIIVIPQVDANIMASDFTTFLRADHNSVQSYLLMMVEWAKRIPGFMDLTMEDQTALLRSFGRKHICLQVILETFRSPDNWEQLNMVFGYGNVVMPIDSNEVSIYMGEKLVPADISRRMDNFFKAIMKSLQKANVTDEEFICFEALLLLGPNVEGLSDPTKVTNMRRSVQSIVMGENSLNPKLAFGVMDLFHHLPEIIKYSIWVAAAVRDTNFYAPLGKCSKLVDELFLCH